MLHNNSSDFQKSARWDTGLSNVISVLVEKKQSPDTFIINLMILSNTIISDYLWDEILDLIKDNPTHAMGVVIIFKRLYQPGMELKPDGENMYGFLHNIEEMIKEPFYDAVQREFFNLSLNDAYQFSHEIRAPKAAFAKPLAVGLTLLYKKDKECFDTYFDLLSTHAPHAAELANAISLLQEARALTQTIIKEIAKNPSHATSIAKEYAASRQTTIIVEDKWLLVPRTGKGRLNQYKEEELTLSVPKLFLSDENIKKIGRYFIKRF